MLHLLIERHKTWFIVVLCCMLQDAHMSYPRPTSRVSSSFGRHRNSGECFERESCSVKLNFDIPMCHKDLESCHDLCKRYTAVPSPVLDSFLALGEDDEAVRFSFVDDFGLGSVSARHVGGGLKSRRFGLVGSVLSMRGGAASTTRP